MLKLFLRQLRIIAPPPTDCSSAITAQKDVVLMSSNNDSDNRKKPESTLGNPVFLETPGSIAFSSTSELFIVVSES